jgi:hypothetical protein
LLDLVKNSENGTIPSENENSSLKPPNQPYTSSFQRATRILTKIYQITKLNMGFQKNITIFILLKTNFFFILETILKVSKQLVLSKET